MPIVRVKEGENADAAIRRFKRAVEKAGIPRELRQRECYQPPSKLRQRAIASARKRLQKRVYRDGSPRRSQRRPKQIFSVETLESLAAVNQ